MKETFHSPFQQISLNNDCLNKHIPDHHSRHTKNSTEKQRDQINRIFIVVEDIVERNHFSRCIGTINIYTLKPESRGKKIKRTYFPRHYDTHREGYDKCIVKLYEELYIFKCVAFGILWPANSNAFLTPITGDK